MDQDLIFVDYAGAKPQSACCRTHLREYHQDRAVERVNSGTTCLRSQPSEEADGVPLLRSMLEEAPQGGQGVARDDRAESHDPRH